MNHHNERGVGAMRIPIQLDDKNPSFSGILAGESKGKTWYNNEDPPTLAVAYSYCVGGCGVVGKIYPEERKPVRRFFETIFASLREMGIDEFEFSTEEEALSRALLDLFRDKLITKEEEYSYRICHSIEHSYKDISNMYQIQVIDELFLENISSKNIKNTNMLMERIENSWNSTTDFMSHSKAIVAMLDHKIIGIIFGSSRYKQYIPLDIEVMEGYRHQGVATQLVCQFVNLCVREGWVVQWDHVESNHESVRLAQKCGFILFKKRPYYRFIL